MKNACTLVLFYLLIAATALGQEHKLNFTAQKMPAVTKGYYIEKIIDGRIVKSSVGEVQLGMFNKKAAAVLPNPLEQELLSFINSTNPRQPDQVPIVLRVNKFWVTENTTFDSESGTAEVLVDFLYRKDSVYYKMFSAAAISSAQGLDVTKKHEENLTTALSRCLKQFSDRSFETMLEQAEPLSPEGAMATYNNAAASQDFPILKATAYTAGVYMTLDEFRRNAPGITSGYEVRDRSGFQIFMAGGSDVIPVQLHADGKATPIKQAWGFADDKAVYINYAGGFYPLLLEGETYTFLGPPLNNGAGAAVTSAAIVGGVVGGAIAAGVAAATAMPVKYSLDLMTGGVLIKGKPVGMNTEGAKLVLYRVAKGEKEQAVDVTINGQQYSLNQNNLVELDLLTTDGGSTICLTGEGDGCISFMPAPDKTYYFSCTLSKKSANDKAEIKETGETVGEYEVKGIRFAQKKVEKKDKKE